MMPRFKKQNKVQQEAYYDLEEDYGLIEASFAKQYGIRLSQEEDMLWPEYCNLLSGLMHDTPLGTVVAIRSEKDNEKLKNFTPEQRKIRNDWILKRNKKLRENPATYKAYVDGFQKWCAETFGKGGK